ncbi:hypothetical protein SB14R_20860 [Pseudomonas oryzihabitans]|nr:hypothetical protein NS376_22165 [Pseudomonas psychrotolerans]KTT13507.1 hypothetical protein NS2R_03975 [Pseudomonas psychrotolerans]KTT21237.1 hypothetical protein SB14R_20860 [Pseudomonas psychrotolerans]
MIDSEMISNYGYGAAVLGALVEGDGVAILAGIAARHGYLLFPLTALCVALGGFIGDQTLFFLGRRYGDGILRRFKHQQQRIDWLRRRIHRHEALWIIGIRFAYGFRLIGPLLIGASGVRPRRFLFYNVIGALLWGFLMTGVGYLVGEILRDFFAEHHVSKRWFFAAAICVVVLFVGARAILRRREGV